MKVPQRVLDRFWSRVDVGESSDCWLFKMSTGSHGYGQIGWQERGTCFVVLAHRVAWYLTNGEIPDDLTVDHMCHVRRCCNPAHLQLLTNVENGRDNGARRRTHCPQGHAYTDANTYRPPGRPTWRKCRVCIKAHNARHGALRYRSRLAK